MATNIQMNLLQSNGSYEILYPQTQVSQIISDKNKILKYYYVWYRGTGTSEIIPTLYADTYCEVTVTISQEIYKSIKNAIYIGVYKSEIGPIPYGSESVSFSTPYKMLDTQYLGEVYWPLALDSGIIGCEYNFIFSGFCNNFSSITGTKINKTEIFNNKLLSLELILDKEQFILRCATKKGIFNATDEDLKNYFNTFWNGKGITYSCFVIGY